MSQVNTLKSTIDRLIVYIDPLLSLANCHMVDYFTHDAYHNLIPTCIQNEINGVGSENVVSLIFNDDLNMLPNLQKFIIDSKQYRLQNCPEVCLSLATFYEELCKFGENNQKPMKLNKFMSSKKSHEVEVLSHVAALLRHKFNTSHIIDIGDGKGYLSSMLAMHYKIPVLGVDASEINTNSSVNRVQKLAKVWNSVTTGEKRKETSKDLYRQITKFINEYVDFNELIENIFLEKPSSISLVGLHTCGNLATASLKIFNQCADIKTICNVGCCYHFLNERFDETVSRLNADYGFPMSNYLNEKQFKIGRSARMMAAQSVDRIFHNRELPSSTIFYRALLQILMQQYYPEIKVEDVGRFRKLANNFLDYTRKALKRLNIDVDLSDETIDAFYEKHKHRREELNIFYLVRAMLAPVVESLILMDRLLYLHENGHENSFLVELFDPVISPRCYGIIGIK